MMFTKTEIIVLELFASRIKDTFTIREVSRLVKKDLKIVYTSIKNLVSKEFLLKDRHNTLMLNTKKHIQEIAYIEDIRKETFLKKNIRIKIHIERFLEKNKKTFFIMLIFGSYATGNETIKSDIDILVVLQENDERFERSLNSILDISTTKFHVNIITEESFNEMISKRGELNIVNETLNSHILICGAENYYKLIGERDD